MAYFYCSPLLASPRFPREDFTPKDAILYVDFVSVSENSELKGIGLIWIPESLRAQCMGKDGTECSELFWRKERERLRF